MAFRTGAVAIVQSTTVAQPLIGSWITASSAPMSGPIQTPITLTLGNATDNTFDATDFFRQGDPVWIIDPNGANAEKCRIQSVPVGSSNTVVLGVQNDFGNYSLRNPHVAGAFGTGSFIALGLMVNNFLLQFEDGATGTYLYLGNQYNMSAVFRRIFKLTKVAAATQPQYYSAAEGFFGAPFDPSELWVLGTTVGDLFNVSLVLP